MSYKSKRSLLEAEVKKLEEEHTRLERELYLATEEETYKTGKSYSYRCAKFFYKAVPLSMLSSVFYQKRDILARKATACFMPRLLKQTVECASHSFDFNPQLHFVMVCEQVLYCGDDGIMFMLSDPYRTIQTTPITTMTIAEAESLVGKVVLAKLIIPGEKLDSDCFSLKAIKELNLHSSYPITHEDWHILRKYISVSGNFECINALKNIEKELLSKYPQTPEKSRKSISMWMRDNEFRIATDNRLMCFCVKNGIILYADEIRYPNKTVPENSATNVNSYNFMSVADAFGMKTLLDDMFQYSSCLPLLFSGEDEPELFT